METQHTASSCRTLQLRRLRFSSDADIVCLTSSQTRKHCWL